jgi:hypothetical protein
MITASPARRPTFFLAVALTITWASTAHAKSVILDDSGSQALEPAVSMRWKSTRPSRARADNLMVGTTTIRVRINVLPWLRRSGRIYLVLPAQPPGSLSASWITQGRLLPGQMQSGNRVLVYAGSITTPFIEDVLKFQFGVDGTLLQRAFPVSYHFEMDEG